MTQTVDWWSTDGQWVETPNRDRGGVSGVQCLTMANGSRWFIKRQTDYLFRSMRYPRGRPTLLREYRNFRMFKTLGLTTPEVVFFDMRRRGPHWEALLVTRALEGYASFRDGLRSGRWDRSRRSDVLDAVLDAVTVLHRRRRKHGHLYPKEIFIDDRPTTPRVAFLDLELSRRCISARQAAASDLKRFLKGLIASELTRDEYRRILRHYEKERISLPRRATERSEQILISGEGTASASSDRADR